MSDDECAVTTLPGATCVLLPLDLRVGNAGQNSCAIDEGAATDDACLRAVSVLQWSRRRGGQSGPINASSYTPLCALLCPRASDASVPIPLFASRGRPSPELVSLCVLCRFARVLVNTSFHRNFDSRHAHSPLISTKHSRSHTLNTCPSNPAPAIRATHIVSIRSMLHTAHRGAAHYARFKGRPTLYQYQSPSSLRSHPAQPHMSPPTQVTYRSTFEPFTTDGELADPLSADIRVHVPGGGELALIVS